MQFNDKNVFYRTPSHRKQIYSIKPLNKSPIGMPSKCLTMAAKRVMMIGIATNRRFSMTAEERNALVSFYLGKTVTIEIDRPIGYVNRKKDYTITYPINYGYLPGVLGGDGEELDVYLFGIDRPVSSFTGRIVGAVYRSDDVEDKLIMAPEGIFPTLEEMTQAVRFQEKYHQSRIQGLPSGAEVRIGRKHS